MNPHLDFAVSLSRQAGQIIRKQSGFATTPEWKSDKSPVTEVDYMINRLVIDEIKSKFPAYNIITEESEPIDKNNECSWVCDPLDGTIAFTHGIPTCVFSIAMVKGGEPIVGVAYDPFLDHLFTAETGRGAFLNGKKITVSKNASLENTTNGITVWNRARYNCVPIIDGLKKKDSIPLNLGSSVYMGMLVASGEFAAAVYTDIKPFDAAAVKIIVEEAGGKVTDLFGEQQRYDRPIKGMVASNGLIHQQVIEITKLVKENEKAA